MTSPNFLASLPNFSAFDVDNLLHNVKSAIQRAQQNIEQLVANGDYSFATLVKGIEDIDEELNALWSPAAHLNAVLSTPELRKQHDACLPLLSEYASWVGQHQGLFAAYQTLRNSDEFEDLSAQQKAAVNKAIRDFTMSGVALDTEKQKRFSFVSSRLSELASQFSNNVLDATMGWSKQVTDSSRLSGLPASALAAARELAQQKNLEGWLFTLDMPSYLPVMMYADDPELREEMYRSYVTRASEQGPHARQWDNSAVIKEILMLREEQAQLLGFSHYAEKSLALKMADSVEQVSDFLHALAKASVPQAKQEFAELQQFAQHQFAVAELQAWDIAYYSEKLKQQRFSISNEALKPYFPQHKVLEGLFNVVNRLFAVTVTPCEGVDTWHPDVQFYAITDQQVNYRGGFYLDLYARENKRGGAWMSECRVRRGMLNGELQLPVAYLVCNFSRPVGNQPALLTHTEVVTLFHEFGHGLHHMLTQVDTAAVSGINGVAWDAVELPSQFLENWCWQEASLRLISAHYETGEPLPQEYLQNMLAARNFQSAMQMVRQLEFSLFDFMLHQQPAAEVNVQQTLDEVRATVTVVPTPTFNRFQNSFSHIFAGGYAAGYYSYKWAEVLSADAFSRFEEEGIFSAKAGADFLQHILEQGGSHPAMTLFEQFRGRPPEVAALLRHNGIAAAKVA